MIDKDWKRYLYFAQNRDWVLEDLFEFQNDLRKRAKKLSKSNYKYFASKWRVPYNPIYLKLGGFDLARTNPSLFNRMKTILRKKGEGKSCWGCGVGYKPKEVILSAHEHWSWDDKYHIRKLSVIRFLCHKCHYLSHHAYWLIGEIPWSQSVDRLGLFCKVNKCTFFEAHAHLEYEYELCHKRQKYKWKIDLSPISGLIEEAELRQKNKKMRLLRRATPSSQ